MTGYITHEQLTEILRSEEPYRDADDREVIADPEEEYERG